MDIEKLKRKRVKSVQDQNAITKASITSLANWWKSGNKLPDPIEKLAEQSGINRSTAILVDESSGPICCEYSYTGCFLTNDGDFWSYEVDLNDKETEIDHIEEWGIIDVEVNPHKKGTGKSWGYLCTEVLEETKKRLGFYLTLSFEKNAKTFLHSKITLFSKSKNFVRRIEFGD